MIRRVLNASSPEVEDLILGIKLGWNKDKSLKGRAHMLVDELSWTWRHHKGALATKGVSLALVASLAHSHFHTASANEAAAAALDAASSNQNIAITTGGVLRSGPVQNGHVQIRNADYPEVNAILKNVPSATCQIAKLDVKEGAWKLPLTQHFGDSSVGAVKYTSARFASDKYACIPDVQPTPSRT